jgi:MraZ protein
MIVGNYTSKLTFSKRVAVPKKIRSFLGRKFTVAKWYENCLVAVPQSSWEALLNKLTGKSEFFTSPVRSTERFILGSAFEIELDSQGRMLVPASLVKFASLSKNVKFVGLGNRVEIWDEKNWEKQESLVSQQAAQHIEKLAEK